MRVLKRNRISELNSSSRLLNVKEMRRHETGQKNIKASLSKANIRDHTSFLMEDLQLQNKKEQIKKKNKKTEKTVTFTLLNDTIGHNKPIKYIQEEIILTKKNSEDFHQKEKKK